METVSESRWRRQRRIALIYLYVVFLFMGVLRGLLWCSSDANAIVHGELLFAIAVSLGFMWYCTADARLMGRPLLPLARLGIFLLWQAGVPIYLLWARRLKGLGVLLLHGFLLLLVLVVSGLITAYLVCGDGFLD